MSDALLPPNATANERALAWATAPHVPVPEHLFDPERCPKHLLPWLAHALSVDVWEPGWPEEMKRTVIRESVMVHRKKGTKGSIRRALSALGHPDAEILEGFTSLRYNGAATYDGSDTYAPDDHWAEYRVVLHRPVSIAQSEVIRSALNLVAPTRCHLKLLDFTEAPHLYDGAITYDGTFTYGAV